MRNVLFQRVSWVCLTVALALWTAGVAQAAEDGSHDMRAAHLKAAVIYGASAGGLVVGGVTLWTVGVVAFPVAWLLQRPFPPAVTVGQPWEHAVAMVTLPWLATGTALLVASVGFGAVALTQVALAR